MVIVNVGLPGKKVVEGGMVDVFSTEHVLVGTRVF